MLTPISLRSHGEAPKMERCGVGSHDLIMDGDFGDKTGGHENGVKVSPLKTSVVFAVKQRRRIAHGGRGRHAAG